MSTNDPLTFHVVFKGETLVILGFNSNICVNYLLCRTTTVYIMNIDILLTDLNLFLLVKIRFCCQLKTTASQSQCL